MMRNLKVDPSLELSESNTVPSKDGSPSDATSCISSAGDATGSVKEDDVLDHDSLTTDQALPYPAENYYYGYYYPGYDATFGGGSNDQVYYVAGDGTELQYPVMQADNGSLMYFMPGIHHNYSSYGTYVPVSMIGVDGEFVAQSPYSPSSMFQPSIPSPGYIPTPVSYGESLPHIWNPSVFAGDGTLGNYGHSGVLEIPRTKPNRFSPSNPRGPVSKKALPSDLSKSLETKTSLPALDVSSGHGMRNQLKLPGKASQHASPFQPDVLGKGYFPFSKFPSYNPGKGAMLYPNNTIKANARGWGSNEKLKTRSKTSGINDALLNEQNHGPRTTNAKGSVAFGGNAAESLGPDGNGNSNSITSVISRDQYNLPDFPTSYDHAFFFVIKSYSEDDIHKSIKYNVWASTPNGNKRLDSAYLDSQQKAQKGCSCPVFLFFSVNASGQFCGVAEMIGRVDFNKNMDFWQQEKWNGYFPVKWHIIKDIPNPQLRHIILENNENKPVTNSRDTQEVKFPQGIEILNIFKKYVSKTSILDDFDFYESRQKVMHERRPRSLTHFDHKQQKTNELITGFQSIDISATKNKADARVGENTIE
ncbi:hypothetical protein NC652_026205 [Populus alba x Populus x berolinensis]|nr:hypothetical protein NC652_026205 [Populus alba x Populus x berolinensis]